MLYQYFVRHGEKAGYRLLFNKAHKAHKPVLNYYIPGYCYVE